MRLLSRDAWRMEIVHRDYSEESLKLATIWVFGIWFVKVLYESMPTISYLPISVYEPLGFVRAVPNALWPVLVSPLFLESLRFLLVLSLAAVFAVMLGDIRALRGRAASGAPASTGRGELLRLMPPLVTCVLLLVYQGVFRGYAGHISHEDTLLLYASFILATFPVANLVARRSGAIDPRVNLNALPVVVILFTMCLIYAVVGVYRLLYGAPTVFLDGSMTQWALRNTVDVFDPGPGMGFLLTEHRWLELLFLAGFPVITAMEITAPLVLFFRPWRIFFLTVFVIFHVLTYLFMDVLFRETLALYALFLDPAKVLDHLRSRRAGSSVREEAAAGTAG
jgi:hypothetical protein